MVDLVVGCNIPGGVILRNYKMIDAFESSPMGMRPIKKAQAVGQSIPLKGSAGKLLEQNPNAQPSTYALNYLSGALGDAFMQWVESQKEADKHHDQGDEDGLLKRHAIIWGETKEKVEAQARKYTKSGVVSGLEPLDPKNLPPEFRGQKLKLVTADEQRVKPETQQPIAFVDSETGERGHVDDGKSRARRRVAIGNTEVR